jgi:BON domain
LRGGLVINGIPPPYLLRKETREMSKTSDIRTAVEAELKFDPRVDDADVHVVNMNGDVALNGTVPSYPQYLEAAAATQSAGCPASAVSGTRSRSPSTSTRPTSGNWSRRPWSATRWFPTTAT